MVANFVNTERLVTVEGLMCCVLCHNKNTKKKKKSPPVHPGLREVWLLWEPAEAPWAHLAYGDDQSEIWGDRGEQHWIQRTSRAKMHPFPEACPAVTWSDFHRAQCRGLGHYSKKRNRDRSGPTYPSLPLPSFLCRVNREGNGKYYACNVH